MNKCSVEGCQEAPHSKGTWGMCLAHFRKACSPKNKSAMRIKPAGVLVRGEIINGELHLTVAVPGIAEHPRVFRTAAYTTIVITLPEDAS
jgi:hypothetical protein